MSKAHPTMSRLYLAATEKGISGQSELARAMNVSPQRVNNWEARGISQEGANLAQAKLGINSTWVLSEQGEMLVTGASEGHDWPDVDGYAQAVGLGDGEEAEEYAETHKLKFRAASLARKGLVPRQLAVVYGKGDSMLPRIRSGDAILFDQADTRPRDETLFVVQAQGVAGSEYSVKRCRDFGDDVYFDALNPEGDHSWRKPRRMDSKHHPITIIGRVRWIGSWED